MSYSENLQTDIRVKDRQWKRTIKGLPDILITTREAIKEKDKAKIENSLRNISKLFSCMRDNEENLTFDELDSLEWFEEEVVGYELENDLMDEFVDEFDYRLSTLYDWADYNRVWIAPEKSKNEFILSLGWVSYLPKDRMTICFIVDKTKSSYG